MSEEVPAENAAETPLAAAPPGEEAPPAQPAQPETPAQEEEEEEEEEEGFDHKLSSHEIEVRPLLQSR